MQKVGDSRCQKSENQKKMEISKVSLFEKNFSCKTGNIFKVEFWY